MSVNERIVRVLRVLEYTGKQDKITEHLSKTGVPLNGEIQFNSGYKIKSAMVGNFPEPVDESEFYGEAKKSSAPAIIVEAISDDRAHFLFMKHTINFDIDEMHHEFEEAYEDNYTLADWSREHVPTLIEEIDKLRNLVEKLVTEKDI